MGELFGGKFNPDNVTWVADAIVKAVTSAQKDVQPATVAYHQLADTAKVRNRAFDEGTIDPFVRTIQLVRNDGQQALIC